MYLLRLDRTLPNIAYLQYKPQRVYDSSLVYRDDKFCPYLRLNGINIELSVTLILKLDNIYTGEWSTSGSRYFRMEKYPPLSPTTYLAVPLNRRTQHIFMRYSTVPLTRKILDS
jgi:hypothetical protein